MYDIPDVQVLRERLTYLIDGSAGKIVPVLGSGMSLGAVPGTAEITERFSRRLSATMRDGLSSRWSTETTVYERYQSAAVAVARAQGDAALTSVIREAVLEACLEPPDYAAIDSPVLRALVRDARWRLTPAHVGFARYYAAIPSEFRGPIITTNFDPLIEVSLREVGVAADPLPIPFDNPPSVAVIDNAGNVPVLHIHGYFADKWSLNSLQHISAERSNLDRVLSSIIADSTVLVVGYGGWQDSFMRVLERHSQQQTIMNAEVIWSAFGSREAVLKGSDLLSRLDGSPGFQMYAQIDAAHLFGTGLGIRERDRPIEVPRGWTLLPTGAPTEFAPLHFTQGGRPNWADATPGRWPWLSPTKILEQSVTAMLEGDGGRGVAAIGPLGEGKSTGLRQVALALAATRDDLTVLWREPGAPSLSTEWWDTSRHVLGRLLLCIDEADLARDDIELIIERGADSGGDGAYVMAASQDRLWWGGVGGHRRDRFETVLYDGLTQDDATAIAESWSEHGLRTVDQASGSEAGEADVAVRLFEAAQSTDGRTTLFGSILEVREAEGLGQRIGEMMESLDLHRVRAGSELTLSEVYGAICVMEHFLDRRHSNERGATRAIIAQMVNADDSLENVAVLRALGREAAVTFAGDRVFSRHPRIAQAAVNWLSTNGRLAIVSELIGRAGGALRAAGIAARSDYVDAYLFGKEAANPEVSLSAARGAIKGANDLMEPRITYISLARKYAPEQAARYARGVTPKLVESRDRRSAIRVFLNELALIDLGEHLYQRCAGLAALLLHNGSGDSATREQIAYGLSTLSRAYSKLIRQNTRHLHGAQLVRAVSYRMLDSASRARFVDPFLASAPRDEAIERLPTSTLLERLARELNPMARQAVDELELPFGGREPGKMNFVLGARVEFSDLVHMSSTA